MSDPNSNPTPRSGVPAYQPDNPVTRQPDGSGIRAVVAKHPRASAPAPTLRDGQGRILPGSGRKPRQ